jgi:hypothetical protein
MLGSTASSTPKGTNGAKARKRKSTADVVLLKRQISAARKKNISVKAIAHVSDNGAVAASFTAERGFNPQHCVDRIEHTLSLYGVSLCAAA